MPAPSPATSPKQYWPALQGLSGDGTVAVFAANAKLTPEADGSTSGYQIYEHVRDPSGEGCGELQLISVLPNGKASPGATVGTGNGPGESREPALAGAVSADASRIYWSSGGTLYLHVDGQKTVQVAAGPAQFWTASPDGSEAIYSVGENLFEYDAASKSSTLIAGGSSGIVGAGQDLSRVYFVSKEALGGEGEVGKENLFLREGSGAGATVRLVGTLAAADFADYGIQPLRVLSLAPYKRGARVSSDGTSVVFPSSANLTGYDNKSVEGGLPSIELYRYEAESGNLDCISCNPSAGRPHTREVKGENKGLARIAAMLPAWENQTFAPRVLSTDGKRLFFDSFDALLPRDTNGAEDVYEWAAADGREGCEEQGAELYVPSAGGCLSLISTGKSPSDSEVIDATPSGSDVFIKTASSILPQDPGLVDIYDAREGGGLPQPPAPPAQCEGEACQGPPAPPNDPTPASSAFEGAGNVTGQPKAKKHKKAHKKKHAKKHRQQRAKAKGRAGR
jgi:hypothetical protein